MFEVIAFIIALLFPGQLTIDQTYEPYSLGPGVYAYAECSGTKATIHVPETAPQEVWLHELAHAYDCATGPGAPGYLWPGEEDVPEWMHDERAREYVVSSAGHCVEPGEYYACSVVYAAKYAVEDVDPIVILHGGTVETRDPETDNTTVPADFMWDPMPVGRITLSVFLGADIDDLVRSVTPYTSVHGTHNGEYVSYIPGAPRFVNNRFLIEFPFPQGLPFVIVQ